MINQSMTVNVMLGSNVDDMIEYLTSLDDGRLAEESRKLFESEANLSRFQGRVKALVKRTIYDRYSPEKYERTYDLLDSFQVSSGNANGDAGFVIMSDPNTAPAKLPSGPDQSYAVFFERPGDYSTFIHPRGIEQEPENYRPFFSELFELAKDYSITAGSRALSKSAGKLRPQSLLARISE